MLRCQLAEPSLVERLVLVSPLLRAPSWTEWLHSKLVLNVLFFAGICDFVKDALLHRYFCEVSIRAVAAGGLGYRWVAGWGCGAGWLEGWVPLRGWLVLCG